MDNEYHDSSETIDFMSILSSDILITGSHNGYLKILNTKETKITADDYLNVQREMTAFLLLKNGQQIATAHRDNIIYLWNCESKSLIGRLLGHDDEITSIVSFSNGCIASSSFETIIVWDANSGIQLRKFKSEESFINSLIVWSDDQIISGNLNGLISIWDLNRESLIKEFKDEKSVGYYNCIVLLPNDILAQGFERGLIIWDIRKTNSPLKYIKTNEIVAIILASNNLLVSAELTGEIKIYDVNSLALVQTLNGINREISSLVQLNSGDLAVGSDKNLFIFKKVTAETMPSIQPDGNILI